MMRSTALENHVEIGALFALELRLILSWCPCLRTLITSLRRCVSVWGQRRFHHRVGGFSGLAGRQTRTKQPVSRDYQQTA
jgi:hypothetical protein